MKDTYKEEMYTTELDEDSVPAEVRAKAERLAREMKAGSSRGRRERASRGGSKKGGGGGRPSCGEEEEAEADEESLHSAVRRVALPGSYTAAAGGCGGGFTDAGIATKIAGGS